MRIKHKVNVQLFDSTDEADKLFYPDDTLAQVVIDNMANYCTDSLAVASGQTVTLSFGHVTAVRGCFFKFKGCDPQVIVNGGDPIKLRRAVAASDATCRVFLEGDITSLQVVADGGAAAGLFVVWGDVIPA